MKSFIYFFFIAKSSFGLVNLKRSFLIFQVFLKVIYQKRIVCFQEDLRRLTQSGKIPLCWYSLIYNMIDFVHSKGVSRSTNCQ